MNAAQNIFYLEKLSKSELNDFYYSMITRYVEKEEIILRPMTEYDELLFVETGVIEVFTEFDGHEFILDRLPQGTFISYKSFFLDD